VIYVCDNHDPDDKEFRKYGWPAHAVKGTKGADVIDELAPAPGDRIVPKSTYSGFYGTRLDDVLRKMDVDSLRLTGCVTHICILFTASDAVLRDYKVTVVEDGVAGITKEDHDAALRIMKSVMGVKVEMAGRRRQPGKRHRLHESGMPHAECISSCCGNLFRTPHSELRT
jgi:nicotinamidase-related amidase